MKEKTVEMEGSLSNNICEGVEKVTFLVFREVKESGERALSSLKCVIINVWSFISIIRPSYIYIYIYMT